MKLLAALCSAALLCIGQLSHAVTIYAAASLTQPLEALADSYQQAHNVRLKLVFAASSTLARQIASGAPADIYISANQTWMQYLEQQSAVQQPVILLQNQLALIVSADSEQQEIALNPQSDLAGLLQGGRLALGNIDHVPVGIYAKQALTSLGLWPQVRQHLAQSQNTRAALALVERKVAPLGIVYSSDAQASERVKVIARIPAASHEPIRYPMARVTRSRTPSEQVEQVYNFLQSSEAKIVLRHYGFEHVE